METSEVNGFEKEYNEDGNEVLYDGAWPLIKKRVAVPTGDIIEGHEEWYYHYKETDVEVFIERIKEELCEKPEYCKSMNFAKDRCKICRVIDKLYANCEGDVQ